MSTVIVNTHVIDVFDEIVFALFKPRNRKRKIVKSGERFGWRPAVCLIEQIIENIGFPRLKSNFSRPSHWSSNSKAQVFHSRIALHGAAAYREDDFSGRI